jgi:hypothetical protein
METDVSFFLSFFLSFSPKLSLKSTAGGSSFSLMHTVSYVMLGWVARRMSRFKFPLIFLYLSRNVFARVWRRIWTRVFSHHHAVVKDKPFF